MTLDELLALLDDAGAPRYRDVGAMLGAVDAEDGKWPKAAEVLTLKELNTFAAIRESDKALLLKVSGRDSKEDSKYRIDPLGDRISDAWAHYLHGQPATYTAANPADQERLDALLPETWQSDLEEAAAVASSEGEIWPRCYLDENGALMVDWISRRDVFPLWDGRRLAAAAIVTELPKLGTSGDVWRHLEIHAVGVVVNVLYRGKGSSIGKRVALASHPSVADVAEVWHHDLPLILMDRIPNRIRRRRRTGRTVGVSDYAAILDVLLDLNDSLGIGAANMRLSAKQRAVISQAAAAGDGGRRDDLALTPEEGGSGGATRAQFDTDEQVFVEDPLDTELGGSSSSPFRILSYEFDSGPLIAWRRELADTGLSRVGLSAQFVGMGDSAGIQYAISGTALRMRLIPQDATGRGKAQYWNVGIPKVLQRLAALASLPVDDGGRGEPWVEVAKLPTYTRSPGIPVDQVEESQRLQTLTTAGLQSLQTSIAQLHPEWDDAQVAAEVQLIRADQGSTLQPTLA